MRVLFVGLGRMGSRMAANLAEQTELLVSDVSTKAVQEMTSKTRANRFNVEELSTVETVILMLPSSKIVDEVLNGPDGILRGMRRGSTVIDMGSSEPSSSLRNSRLATSCGIGFIDAPVSGGVDKAASGSLSIMVGASVEKFEEALPILKILGERVIHVGEVGTGHASKALNNVLSAANVAAAGEVLSIAAKFGIDPEKMLDVINSSTGRSQATEVKFPSAVIPGTFSDGFSLELQVKDLRIAQDLATELGVDLDITGASVSNAEAALVAHGGSSPDHTVAVKQIASRAGVAFGASLPE